MIEVNVMLLFIVGMMVGGLLGVAAMCLLFVASKSDNAQNR